MKAAFVTEYDARDITSWSGLSYHISDALETAGVSIEYVGPLKYKFGWGARLKRKIYTKLLRQGFHAFLQPEWAEFTAQQINERLEISNANVVLCPHPQTLGRLRCNRPTVLWSDATFAGLLNFYSDYTNLCAETIRNGHALDQHALNQCRLAIFASEWAAQTAIETYHTDPVKVKVVPFGANIECHRTRSDIEQLMASRPSHECRLIFIGRIWERKGGDLAVEVAQRLNEAGLPTTLTMIGGKPPPGKQLPPFVQSLGFINKSTAEGRRRFDQLLGESHFLILPTRADCFGVVFCEASSFGVPSLTTSVGGVPSAVRDGVNGKTFPLSAPAQDWADHIRGLFARFPEYQNLARSSFGEYEARLNWKVSARKVRELLET
jgi:glycosyltransferase involved in cell wall biosynthesis